MDELLGFGSIEGRVRSEIGDTLGEQRQQRYRRFLLAALGGVPWVGGLIAALTALQAESAQATVSSLQQDWLDEHSNKLAELTASLAGIVKRLETFGDDVRQRIESDDYLALVRKGFRVWDHADTDEKRKLIVNLLTNAGATPLTEDDVVRLFIEWIDSYHEAHFAVIRVVFQNPGSTRADVWRRVHGAPVREDSAEADLFKLLIRDLSTGSVIRQHRDTTVDGRFVARKVHGKTKGSGTLKSAFSDVEEYELTELGSRFVHYTMNEVVPRIG